MNVFEVSEGAARIAAERARQVEAEGFDRSHDDEHTREQLAIAAACYAIPPRLREARPRLAAGYGDDRGDRYRHCPVQWPWHPDDWKPADRLRELEKAGALVAAEIDRLLEQGGAPVTRTLEQPLMARVEVAARAAAIEVTVRDTDTGETDSRTIDDDYVIVCAGSCYLDGVQAFGNGTHQLTVKGKRGTA